MFCLWRTFGYVYLTHTRDLRPLRRINFCFFWGDLHFYSASMWAWNFNEWKATDSCEKTWTSRILFIISEIHEHRIELLEFPKVIRSGWVNRVRLSSQSSNRLRNRLESILAHPRPSTIPDLRTQISDERARRPSIVSWESSSSRNFYPAVTSQNHTTFFNEFFHSFQAALWRWVAKWNQADDLKALAPWLLIRVTLYWWTRTPMEFRKRPRAFRTAHSRNVRDVKSR